MAGGGDALASSRASVSRYSVKTIAGSRILARSRSRNRVLRSSLAASRAASAIAVSSGARASGPQGREPQIGAQRLLVLERILVGVSG